MTIPEEAPVISSPSSTFYLKFNKRDYADKFINSPFGGASGVSSLKTTF